MPKAVVMGGQSNKNEGGRSWSSSHALLHTDWKKALQKAEKSDKQSFKKYTEVTHCFLFYTQAYILKPTLGYNATGICKVH